MTNEKILEVEDLLTSLSDEMLKLKSASKHYEETRENLQNMCESIDRISNTHKKLTGKLSQLLAEIGTLEASLSKKYNEISKEIRKQTDQTLQHNVNQSKAMRFMKSIILLGVFMEAVVIILILLFSK